MTARFPQQLAGRLGDGLRPRQPGVYEADSLGLPLRLVVANQLALEPRNVMLHLFSVRGEAIAYGVGRYEPRSETTSSLLLRLIHRHFQEGVTMPDYLEEYARESIPRLFEEEGDLFRKFGGESLKRFVRKLPARDRVEGMSGDELLDALSPEQKDALRRRLQAGDRDAPPAGG